MRCPVPIYYHLALFLILVPSFAFSWPAKVASVADGDTIIVLHEGVQVIIRLHDTD